MIEQGNGVSSVQQRSLEATKIKACTQCRAPGLYRAPKNAAEVIHYANWPGIVVDTYDPRDGQPVGDTCPCCGASRVGLIEKLGVIWRGFLPGRRFVTGDGQ